jgi:hypothetical protein
MAIRTDLGHDPGGIVRSLAGAVLVLAVVLAGSFKEP